MIDLNSIFVIDSFANHTRNKLHTIALTTYKPTLKLTTYNFKHVCRSIYMRN